MSHTEPLTAEEEAELRIEAIALHAYYKSMDGIYAGSVLQLFATLDNEREQRVAAEKERDELLEALSHYENIDYATAESIHKKLWEGDTLRGGWAPTSPLLDIVLSNSWEELEKAWEDNEWTPREKWKALSTIVIVAVDVPSEVAHLCQRIAQLESERAQLVAVAAHSDGWIVSAEQEPDLAIHERILVFDGYQVLIVNLGTRGWFDKKGWTHWRLLPARPNPVLDQVRAKEERTDGT